MKVVRQETVLFNHTELLCKCRAGALQSQARKKTIARCPLIRKILIQILGLIARGLFMQSTSRSSSVQLYLMFCLQ